jgi:hypothetical protein
MVARGLEDESYRRWLEHRDDAPGRWRRDEAFSQVVYLTPDKMAGMAEVIRALIAQYRHREAAMTWASTPGSTGLERITAHAPTRCSGGGHRRPLGFHSSGGPRSRCRDDG